MKTWLTRDEALELLKVRPQTLYAYVSRGQIGMRSDPDDPRRSLYRAADISGLTRRRERGKRPAAIAASTIAWGEPIITTAISTVLRGRFHSITHGGLLSCAQPGMEVQSSAPPSPTIELASSKSPKHRLSMPSCAGKREDATHG